MHDHVDHAVRQEVLGALEAFGQLLADRLLNDARTRKANERARLGDVDVAQHGVGGRHAARRRVGQHDDIGQARLAQLLHGNRRARHLHEREDAFLHARAARGGKQDEGCLLLDRAQQPGDHRLARRHAERPGHEAEVLRGGNDLLAVQRSLADEDRVIEAGRRLCVAQTIRIAAPVAKLQRILGDGVHRHLLVGAAVEEMDEARIRAHAHVVVRAGHDELVGLEVLVEDHLASLGAFHPQIVRHLALRREEAAYLRADNVVDPIHAYWPLNQPRRLARRACLPGAGQGRMASDPRVAYRTARNPLYGPFPALQQFVRCRPLDLPARSRRPAGLPPETAPSLGQTAPSC